MITAHATNAHHLNAGRSVSPERLRVRIENVPYVTICSDS